jgi:hypothetical protein
MRAVFTIVGLVVVLGIVGVLARKQLTSGVAPRGAAQAAGAPTGTPQQQVQQFQKALDAAMQQPRPMPDESK